MNFAKNRNQTINCNKKQKTFFKQNKQITMGNQICTTEGQTEFKKRMRNLCDGEGNKIIGLDQRQVYYSENNFLKDNSYKQDSIKENSLDVFTANLSDNNLIIKKDDKPSLLTKQDSNEISHTVTYAQIKPHVVEDKSQAGSPMRKAKIDLNQIYLKHVKSNNEEGNLNYQPIPVPFSVIKIIFNKNLLNLLMQQHPSLTKYNDDQSSFKLYKGGWYGHILSQNYGIFLNKDYFYEGFFLQNNGQFKPQNNGTYITEKGKYIGEFQDGKPHGKGKYIEFSSDESSKKATTYQGQWVNGMLTKGILENNIFKFEGNLLHRKPHGHGKIYLKQPNISYAGQFNNGLFHGKNCIYETPLYSYLGDFENAKKNGKGVLLEKTALLQNPKNIKKLQRYEGYWKSDKFQSLSTTPIPK